MERELPEDDDTAERYAADPAGFVKDVQDSIADTDEWRQANWERGTRNIHIEDEMAARLAAFRSVNEPAEEVEDGGERE